MKETSFFSDVFKLVTGAAIAQVLGIITTPIISRLFAPEAFGLAALFTSIIAVVSIVATMRYELTIMLPERDEEAVNLVGISLGFLVLINGLISFVLLIFKEPLLRLFKISELAPYIWLIPLAVFTAGAFTTLRYWNSRKKNFGYLSIAQVTNSASTMALTLGWGSIGYVTGGTLIGSRIIGQAIATGVLAGKSWLSEKDFFRKSINWHNMLGGIKRYKKFPLYSLWAALLNTASWQLPVFLLSIFFSPTVVGYYALGFRIIQMPMNMVGAAIGRVFFQRASEAKIGGSLEKLVKETFRQLVMFSLFPMLLLTLISSELFTVVFGASWTEAGVYTQILAPWGFVWFISSPLSTLIVAFEKQEFGLFINILIFLTRLISLIVGGLLENAKLALILFSVSGFLVYGYLNLWLMGLAGVSLKKVFRILVPYFWIFIPVIGSLTLLKFFDANEWVILAIASIFGIIYAVYLAKTLPQFRAMFHLKRTK